MNRRQKWSRMGDSTPKNEEIHPQAECRSNRAEQFFQILTTLRLAWFAQG
jgi:hypothetical protein